MRIPFHGPENRWVRRGVWANAFVVGALAVAGILQYSTHPAQQPPAYEQPLPAPHYDDLQQQLRVDQVAPAPAQTSVAETC